MPSAKPRVLVVDYNLDMAQTLAEGLCAEGFEAFATGSGAGAAQELRSNQVNALVTDLLMPEGDGMSLLGLSRRLVPERPVIMMAAYDVTDAALESIRQGAYHYLTKPFRAVELVLFLQRALEESRIRREAAALRKTLRGCFSTERILGDSAAIRNLREVIAWVATIPAPVLILGETGTGKSLVAQAIHAESQRARHPLVVANCAALTEPLPESDLFGCVKGAFTGATKDRSGLFREAKDGTLFLDEIGEIAPGVQTKLLHAIEHGTIRSVGSSEEEEVDVRILAATRHNLGGVAKDGTFSEDLLCRLGVVTISIPTLRDRREDLPELIAYFLRQARAKYPGSVPEQLSREAFECLLAYDWPGNVRELAHMMEKLVLLGRSPRVRLEDLPVGIRQLGYRTVGEFQGDIVPIRELQRRYAIWALAQVGGHRGKAADRLGIDAKTLWKWLYDVRGELGRRHSAGHDGG